jgi:hypothetical protein
VKGGGYTPHNTITDQTGKTKGEGIAHEQRAGELSETHNTTKTGTKSCDLACSLLPRGKFLDLDGSFGRGRFGGSRRGCGARCGRQNLTILGDNGTSNNLVRQVDSKLFILRCHRKQELGDVVGVQSGRLGGEARWEVSVTW